MPEVIHGKGMDCYDTSRILVNIFILCINPPYQL